MDNIILEQLSKYFKEMIQEIMLKEREAYLKDHIETRGNGYYRRTPKTIFEDMNLIPWTRDGNFKPSIIPERKRVTFIKKWSKLYNYFNNLRGKIDNYTYFFKYSQ